jgi:hypothetical protein
MLQIKRCTITSICSDNRSSVKPASYTTKVENVEKDFARVPCYFVIAQPDVVEL